MQIIQVEKRSGGTRKIYVPSREEKGHLRSLLAVIPQPDNRLASAHGFRSGRSPVTNALEHQPNYIAGAVMLSLDLSDFFGSVTPEQVLCYLPRNHQEGFLMACFPDGAAQQGLPTSPALANLAGIAIDEAILQENEKHGWNAVYTRYADDLTLSFPSMPDCGINAVIASVDEIVRRHGHRLNRKKIRIQQARSGRWECCGVMLDERGVHVSRKQRRLLRAMEHNLAAMTRDTALSQDRIKRIMHIEQWMRRKAKGLTKDERKTVDLAYHVRGLREWTKLKKPCDGKKNEWF